MRTGDGRKAEGEREAIRVLDVRTSTSAGWREQERSAQFSVAPQVQWHSAVGSGPQPAISWFVSDHPKAQSLLLARWP